MRFSEEVSLTTGPFNIVNLLSSYKLTMLNGPVVRETSSLNLIQSMILQINNVEWSSCKGDFYTKSHT
jgi:hypothetical protein